MAQVGTRTFDILLERRTEELEIMARCRTARVRRDAADRHEHGHVYGHGGRVCDVIVRMTPGQPVRLSQANDCWPTAAGCRSARGAVSIDPRPI